MISLETPNKQIPQFSISTTDLLSLRWSFLKPQECDAKHQMEIEKIDQEMKYFFHYRFDNRADTKKFKKGLLTILEEAKEKIPESDEKKITLLKEVQRNVTVFHQAMVICNLFGSSWEEEMNSRLCILI